MTPEAKKLLSSTVRALRARLLGDLQAAMETEYRLGVVRVRDAGLGEAAARKRARLEAWVEEQLRAQGVGGKGKQGRTREDFRREVEQQAAYTLLNRLVVLRLMEASGLRREAVATRGWESTAYKTLRELAPALVQGETSEGYALLLRLVCEELAQDLPGLFGSDGVAALVPVPAGTLRHAVEVLDQPGLASCWTDDMTLGWVYQYWNDPEREALDAKLNARGKLEPHEVASKTQMFTERYMVDWLLQNTLGPMWLAICAQHGWTPEAGANGTLAALEARRVEWRGKRERGEVALTELMPLHTDAERRWAYYVPQPLPADAIEKAVPSVRMLRLLDPAVGSGHFLIVAFDLLFALYQEEARHRGEAETQRWSPRAIVERILEFNLHGIDLDPRAVQIAAAALWLKAKQACPEAQPRRLGLVAANLRLSGLKKDDPALVELRREVERDTGIPEALVDTVVEALKGADHVGSLLRVDDAVEQALDAHEQGPTRRTGKAAQGFLFGANEAHPTGTGTPEGPSFPPEQRELIGREEAKNTILDRLEGFLKKHTHGDDLGLRLRGEQLAAGVRFVRLIREGQYDLVVGNPPYQGTAKMADAAYVQKTYPKGKADLYAAFLERGLQLARPGGVSALLTLRNWMFIKQYSELRRSLLKNCDLRALGDFDRGAFEEVPDEVVSVVASVFHRASPNSEDSVALQPTLPTDRSRDSARTLRKRAATLAGDGQSRFSVQALRAVAEWPVVFWWTPEFLRKYSEAVKAGDVMESHFGLRTSNNARFIRQAWEVRLGDITVIPVSGEPIFLNDVHYAPHVMGASGRKWIDDLSHVIDWSHKGLTVCVTLELAYKAYPQSTEFYFRPAVALPKIGTNFSARAVRYRSVIDVATPCVFPDDVSQILCSFNQRESAFILEGLNPTMNLQPGDIDRLPIRGDPQAVDIWERLERAFTEHESHREPSVEFRRPGPSPWRHAQEWAQVAVDRPEGAPLPAYVPEHDPEPATDHLSNALGVALGRFGPAGEGILDPSSKDSLAHALPAGILFLDGTLDAEDHRDSLAHPSARPLHEAFEKHGPAIAPGTSLRAYLSKNFFELHRKMYENRPIHWPLSSADRTFVAWVTIHRWDGDTLRVLLADHLHPTLTRIDGALADLRAARDGADKKASRAAEKRVTTFQKARDELAQFIASVEQCAEKGPPPADAKKAEREVDARYVPDLDDGVMVNSAALWPLLAPQWKDPKKWWKELATADGKKDYDWSHLAMRYWPRRVDAKCQQDPSLAVAHGCFFKYHPARAWAWELRLQDEIGPGFRIEEAPYRGDGGHEAHRTAFIADHPVDALAGVEKEALRRIRKHKRRLGELVLPEAGLWGARPDLCWELELRVLEKQEQDFKLRAPDEPAARATFERRFPDEVKRRLNLLESLRPTDILIEGDEDEGVGADEDAGGEDDEA
jgi:hypothetical protein